MTEEQKEIVLFGSRIEILNKYIDFSKDGIIEREQAIKAMQEYAELYYLAKSTNTTKPINQDRMSKNTKTKTAKELANESWLMLPNDCKIIMKDLKKSYLKSLEADIDDALKKSYEAGFSNGLH